MLLVLCFSFHLLQIQNNINIKSRRLLCLLTWYLQLFTILSLPNYNSNPKTKKYFEMHKIQGWTRVVNMCCNYGWHHVMLYQDLDNFLLVSHHFRKQELSFITEASISASRSASNATLFDELIEMFSALLCHFINT